MCVLFLPTVYVRYRGISIPLNGYWRIDFISQNLVWPDYNGLMVSCVSLHNPDHVSVGSPVSRNASEKCPPVRLSSPRPPGPAPCWGVWSNWAPPDTRIVHRTLKSQIAMGKENLQNMIVFVIWCLGLSPCLWRHLSFHHALFLWHNARFQRC